MNKPRKQTWFVVCLFVCELALSYHFIPLQWNKSFSFLICFLSCFVLFFLYRTKLKWKLETPQFPKQVNTQSFVTFNGRGTDYFFSLCLFLSVSCNGLGPSGKCRTCYLFFVCLFFFSCFLSLSLFSPAGACFWGVVHSSNFPFGHERGKKNKNKKKIKYKYIDTNN